MNVIELCCLCVQERYGDAQHGTGLLHMAVSVVQTDQTEVLVHWKHLEYALYVAFCLPLSEPDRDVVCLILKAEPLSALEGCLCMRRTPQYMIQDPSRRHAGSRDNPEISFRCSCLSGCSHGRVHSCTTEWLCGGLERC